MTLENRQGPDHTLMLSLSPGAAPILLIGARYPAMSGRKLLRHVWSGDAGGSSNASDAPCRVGQARIFLAEEPCSARAIPSYQQRQMMHKGPTPN